MSVFTRLWVRPLEDSNECFPSKTLNDLGIAVAAAVRLGQCGDWRSHRRRGQDESGGEQVEGLHHGRF